MNLQISNLTGVCALVFVATAFFSQVALAQDDANPEIERWDEREEIDLSKSIQPLVNATVETQPVAAPEEEDSADDPAIWVSSDSSKAIARIYGTNKKAGIHVYDIDGNEIQFLKVGLVNNIDVRYEFPMDGEHVDIAAASNRSHQSIDIYKIKPCSGQLELIHRFKVTSAIDEIYGFCLAHDRMTGTFYALANGKNGVVEQWKLSFINGAIKEELVRTLRVPSQTEGMVADDLQGRLFVGEEEKGIWVFELDAAANQAGSLIPSSTPAKCENLAIDVEGLTLYYLSETEGYLLASSQGNHSYAIFDRNPPFSYKGSFSINEGTDIDGVEETDGIDVINLPLGTTFPNGCFIAQDGYNFDEQGNATSQNFKLVKWEQIATALQLNTDSTFKGWR